MKSVWIHWWAFILMLEYFPCSCLSLRRRDLVEELVMGSINCSLVYVVKGKGFRHWKHISIYCFLGAASAQVSIIQQYRIPIYLRLISRAVSLKRYSLFSFVCRELITTMFSHMRNGLKWVVAVMLRKNEEKMLKWPKCKESRCLITTTGGRRNLTSECTGYECV